jgi:AcrR family transcriptional regulator
VRTPAAPTDRPAPPRSHLRAEQAAQTRARVLAAARGLIEAHGVEAAHTRAVAAVAGVSVGAVFSHFPDKAALFEALLHDEIEAALDRALPPDPLVRPVPPVPPVPPDPLVEPVQPVQQAPLAAQLVAVAEALWATYDARPDLSRALLSQTLFLSGPGRPLSAQLDRFRAWVGGALGAAAARGAPHDIDPPTFFSAYFSIYFGLLVGGLRGELPAGARGPLLREALDRLLAPRAEAVRP